MTSEQYSSRRTRNTEVLIKWIEEHQANPYPTKAEKQYLAYHSGMNVTELSAWFENARRRIKKIGMKTWLEGRSTFTANFFPTAAASTFTPSRANVSADYLNGSGSALGLGSDSYSSSAPFGAGLYPATSRPGISDPPGFPDWPATGPAHPTLDVGPYSLPQRPPTDQTPPEDYSTEPSTSPKADHAETD